MVQYFTKQGLEELKKELDYLKNVEQKKVVALIAEAAAFGDLKENSAYHDARDKMSFLKMRIEELECAINEAVIREKSSENIVQVGSFVSILLDAEEQKYQITAPGEANILQNKISYQSPLGKELLGKTAGKEFAYQAGDKKVKVKIIKIS
jgi:transcription elongation factor GreA